MTSPGGSDRGGTPAGERGTVLLAVLVVAALVGAAALGALLLAEARRSAEERLLAREEALRLARSAARGVAGWFEAAERGALQEAPPGDLPDRDRRRVDPDGDGRGVPWRDASPPWNVRWKDPPARPFRPPDGPGPGDRLAGTPRGPDWVLERGAGETEAGTWLAAWSARLAPGSRARLALVSLCGPRPGSPGEVLGRVIAVAEVDLPGPGLPVRVAVAGDLVRVPWGAFRRPLVVSGDAHLAGDVSWERGEGVIGGDLVAPAGIEDRWPGGIPWSGPDRPVRRDEDGDGTDDDADGDGTGDWVAWRDLPGPVPDPWWRARVGGTWRDRFSPRAACAAPWPFGPRRRPPAPPVRADRSGFFLRCPVPGLAPPVPSSWWELAGTGVRGTARLVEEPGCPGRFRLDGAGPARPLAELLPATGGLRRIEAAGERTAPLGIVLDGLTGGLLVRGAAVRVSGGDAIPGPGRAPADPPDTGGEDRPGAPGDPRLALADPGGTCAGFTPGAWGDPAARRMPRACPPRPVALEGLLAVAGRLLVDGGVVVAGQVRAGELRVDGTVSPVRFRALPGPGDDPGRRPGVPGAPRVVVRGLRELPAGTVVPASR